MTERMDLPARLFGPMVEAGTSNDTASHVVRLLQDAVDADRVKAGAEVADDLHHDEALGIDPVVPACVVRAYGRRHRSTFGEDSARPPD